MDGWSGIDAHMDHNLGMNSPHSIYRSNTELGGVATSASPSAGPREIIHRYVSFEDVQRFVDAVRNNGKFVDAVLDYPKNTVMDAMGIYAEEDRCKKKLVNEMCTALMSWQPGDSIRFKVKEEDGKVYEYELVDYGAQFPYMTKRLHEALIEGRYMEPMVPMSMAPRLALADLKEHHTVEIANKAEAGDKNALKQLVGLVKDGYAPAHLQLCKLYFFGCQALGLKQDHQLAFHHFDIATAQGGSVNVHQIFQLGLALLPEEQKAEKCIEAAARRGHAYAQFLIGMRDCQKGSEPSEDNGWLLQQYGWLQQRQAAKQDFAPALFRLGWLALYEKGFGTAIAHFRKAADQGHVLAQYHLCELLIDIQGGGDRYSWDLRRQAQEIINQYQTNAQSNSTDQIQLGCYQLGMMAFSAYRTDQAIRYFEKAASIGHGLSQIMLSIVYKEAGHQAGAARHLLNASQQKLLPALSVMAAQFLKDEIGGSQPDAQGKSAATILRRVPSDLLQPILHHLHTPDDIRSEDFSSKPWWVLNSWDALWIDSHWSADKNCYKP